MLRRVERGRSYDLFEPRNDIAPHGGSHALSRGSRALSCDLHVLSGDVHTLSGDLHALTGDVHAESARVWRSLNSRNDEAFLGRFSLG